MSLVEGRLRERFVERGVTALVSSAACGADLIAQRLAGVLALQRRVVLPFAAPKFREGSVVDRPGDWGALFDRVIREVGKDVVIAAAGEGDAAYARTNEVIVTDAVALARELDTPAAAIVVWDLQSRGPGDLTEQFRDLARAQGLDVMEVSTR